MKKSILAFVCVFLLCERVSAELRIDYQSYENILLSQEALSVRCFVQDPQGLMWVGSDKGLFSYDGYTVRQHFTYGDSANLAVNFALLYGDDHLLLGSQKGVLMYNYKCDAYEDFPLRLPYEVQTMAFAGGDLWIGSMGGLFRYDPEQNICEQIAIGKEGSQLPTMVYSVLAYEDCIYIGSSSCFGRYDLQTKQFETIIPSGNERSESVFVNSLLKDIDRGCIWIGTSHALLKYTLATHTLEYKEDFPFIKAMTLDAGNQLVIGTDNGLCIYNEAGTAYRRHDSRDSKSLANNIVWAVYTDSEHNIWAGTDYGVSLSPCNRHFEFIPIHQLTGSADGNQIYSIYRDTHRYYWLGGTSGLIRTDALMPGADSRWYMMSTPERYIAHNRIRHVCEDKDTNLWALSDGGISRYNYATECFQHYFVIDSTETYHSSWAYHMIEDNAGNLWIATCMSGILVVNKKRLLQAPFSVADKCFNTANGLGGNFVSHLAIDKNNIIWALIYNVGVERINPQTNEVTRIRMPEEAGSAKQGLLLCDSEGFIWVTFRGGVTRIDASSLQTETALFTDNPLAMTEARDHIWISSTNSIRMISKRDMSVHHRNILNRTFTGLYYDYRDQRVCLGGIDGLSIAHLSLADHTTNDSPIIITGLHINSLVQPAPNHQGKSIRYLDRLMLHHSHNTFTLEFSDFSYPQEQRSSFIYRLNQTEEAWRHLKANENTITFTNLEHGKYLLQISRLGVNGQPAGPVKSFEIEALAPWYLGATAKVSYVVLLLVMTFGALYFFKVRSQLRFERLEKEQTIEQSKLKIDFFTEISHEFKTPLSLIIALISRLLLEARRTPEDKKTFNLIYQNAMKLSSLIHQAIDFYRDDKKHVGMITSSVEFIEFARALFSTYAERMKDKHVDLIFSTGLSKIYLNIDVVKIESVLNNILSNACKYTSENDSIVLSIERVPDGELEIRISDTGSGIPPQDQPYIFQRFFQSPAPSAKKEGTGIGLYMARKFVEMHGGSIRVESGENNGASFIIRLPAQCLSENHDTQTEALAGEDRPLIVIAEDNIDMAEFICDMFAPEYRCVVAHNGKIGLKLGMELLPDLIIADVMMPVMDGMEMCRRLKAYVPASTIPLILLTAKDDKDTELDSIRSNIDAFIAKPFDLHILHSRVKQLIASKKQLEKKVRIEILSAPQKVEAHVSHAEKLLANVTRVIEENLADPDFNVNTLSETVGISQKQIYRKIKELTGMTTIEYIRSIKMKKAALLLTGRKFTVQEVMYMVGFSNHSYFAKCFFAHFGIHPNQYNEGN